MPVTNSKHSFVDFEDRLEDIILDSYRAELAFQFLFSADMLVPRDDLVKIKVGDTAESTIYFGLKSLVQDICFWGIIGGIDFDNDFPLVIPADQIIPAATYETADDFYAALQAVGFNATSDTFLQCCSENMQDYEIDASVAEDPRTITINFYRGLCYVDNTGNAQDAQFTSHGITSGKCYKLVITHPAITQKFWSNAFQRITSVSEFYTFLTYYNNEDSYSFYYPQVLANKLWLPFFMRKPTYSEERKVYRKSNRVYKTLSASIEKFWECVTDHWPDDLHDRMIVAMVHDNTFFRNNFFSEQVWKKPGEEYAIEWQDKYAPDMAQAQAKFKVYQVFAGRNSNCEKRPTCVALPIPLGCVDASFAYLPDLPDGIIGEEYYFVIYSLEGSQPFTLSDIVAPSWMNITIEGSTIVISGTPDTGSDGDIVSFTVSNCEEGSVSFSDTILVTGGGGLDIDDITYDLETHTTWDLTSVWKQDGATIHSGGILGSEGGTSPFTAADELHDGTYQVTVHSTPGPGFVWIRWTGGERKVILDVDGNSSEQTITIKGDVTISYS